MGSESSSIASAAGQASELRRLAASHRAADLGPSTTGLGVGRAVANPRTQALDAGVKSRAEGVLGADFSSVRVHTGDDVAHQRRARAVTMGPDIHLADGESPRSARLLGHELAHVIQQGAVSPGGTKGDGAKAQGGESPGLSHEVEADAASVAVAQQRSFAVVMSVDAGSAQCDKPEGGLPGGAVGSEVGADPYGPTLHGPPADLMDGAGLNQEEFTEHGDAGVPDEGVSCGKLPDTSWWCNEPIPGDRWAELAPETIRPYVAGLEWFELVHLRDTLTGTERDVAVVTRVIEILGTHTEHMGSGGTNPPGTRRKGKGALYVEGCGGVVHIMARVLTVLGVDFATMNQSIENPLQRGHNFIFFPSLGLGLAHGDEVFNTEVPVEQRLLTLDEIDAYWMAQEQAAYDDFDHAVTTTHELDPEELLARFLAGDLPFVQPIANAEIHYGGMVVTVHDIVHAMDPGLFAYLAPGTHCEESYRRGRARGGVERTLNNPEGLEEGVLSAIETPSFERTHLVVELISKTAPETERELLLIAREVVYEQIRDVLRASQEASTR